MKQLRFLPLILLSFILTAAITIGLASCSNLSIPNPFAPPVKQLTVELIYYTATPSITLTATFEPTPTEIFTPTETQLPLLSENPTGDELFAAKQGQIPDIFYFGGHEWWKELNVNGNKIWTRDVGKIDLEWVSLYGGTEYNTYMFVSRSTSTEGKRSLEIYNDPRDPFSYVITGSPDAIDTFVGTTVPNYIHGSAAKAALKQPGSILKIIIGSYEYRPIKNSGTKPQDLYYPGPNGEILSQKIWSMDAGNGIADVGPFVETSGSAVQCGELSNANSWDIFLPQYFRDNPSIVYLHGGAQVVAPIRDCASLDPESKKPVDTGSFGVEMISSLVNYERIRVK